MAPPNPIQCSVPTCNFSTPENTPTWEMMTNLLKIHTDAVHRPPAAQVAPGATSAKLEKLPRPKFSLEMTEAEWKFKEQSWKAYIGQTPNLAEETKVQQLQAACEESLLRRVHDSGGLTQFVTEVALLARIKTLAVKVTHQTMHIQNLHKMKQDPEEGIRAFASRLVGTAALCDLTVTCSG